VSEVEVIRTASLGALPHGFLGRRGGVSVGECAGLNVGFGSSDDREAIAENRRRAVDALLSGAELATVHQIHSAEVVVAEQAWPQDQRPRADAMVTDRPNLLLGILTADCAPVLFADGEAGVVGAAHAGWRGAVAGVLEATIEAMLRLGARRDRIVAAVGPCIGQASYEVAADLRDAVMERAPDDARFFADGLRAARWQFDLPGYCAARLYAAGVSEVVVTGIDTLAEEDRFFSHRRRTLANAGPIGHQISVIAVG
jgi:polyphenol oxidase